MRSPKQRTVIGEIMTENNAAHRVTIKINIVASRYPIEHIVEYVFGLHLRMAKQQNFRLDALSTHEARFLMSLCITVIMVFRFSFDSGEGNAERKFLVA